MATIQFIGLGHMGRPMASNLGESLFMVGASDQDYRRVQPLLGAMGTMILHCGPVGAGGKTKVTSAILPDGETR